LSYNSTTGTLTLTESDGNTVTATGFNNNTVSNLSYNNTTGVLTLTESDGSTFTAGGFQNEDLYVTGGTIDYNTGELTLDRQDAQVTVTGFHDYYVTGMTWNPGTFDLDILTNNGDFNANLYVLATDMTVTGGTYDPVTGVATFTTNSGNTFGVSGFTTGYTDVRLTGATFDYNTGTLSLTNTDGSIVTATGMADNFITSGSYNSGTGVLSLNRKSGSTITIPGFSTGGGSGVMIAGTGTGSTVRCGTGNAANGVNSFSVGFANTVQSTGNCSAILGGCSHLVDNPRSVIIGGFSNATYSFGSDSVLLGGNNNNLGSRGSTILGGTNNRIQNAIGTDVGFSTIIGGTGNDLLETSGSTIGSSLVSLIENSRYSTISSGCFNTILNSRTSSINGGSFNTINSCNPVIIGGGGSNTFTQQATGFVFGSSNRVSCSTSLIYGVGNQATSNSFSDTNWFIGNSNIVTGGTVFDNLIVGNSNTLRNTSYQNTILGFINKICNNSFRNSIVGRSNTINSICDSHIIGTSITADRNCTTFVNNLSIKNIPTTPPAQSGAVWRCPGEDILRIVV
jgi:hypothetical protein